MTQNELDLIIQEGEGYKIEFKENLNTDFGKELVAFANASGGKIFLGIDNSGIITGVTITNDLKSRVIDKANNCDPPVDVELEAYNNVLIIKVNEGNNKPYRTTNGFYLRVGPNSQKLNTDQIIEFIQAEGRVKFDELLNFECDFNTNFSQKLLSNYLNLAEITKSINTNSILNNLSAIQTENGETKFTNSGVLFFTKDPLQFLPQALVVCAIYDGNEKVNILDKKEFSGDIISNIESAINFVKQNLKKRFEIDRETRRKEVLEIPEPAIREAIINAIVHRDYFVKGANVTVEIFNDRLMITNPGGLPKGFPENEFGNISLSRNPTIASLLLRAKYIEKMETGINRIKSAFNKENLPDPIFEYNTFFKVIFKRKDIVFAFQKKFDVNKVLAERMTNILTILYRDKNIDIKEVAEIHNVSDRTIRNDLKKLFDLELVLTTGKSKSKKYFITIKGEDFVSENT